MSLKLNFKVPLLDFDEKPMKENGEGIFLNRVLANNIARLTKGIEPMKGYEWSMTLWKEGVLTLDGSDAKKLEMLIEKEIEGISLLVRGSMLKVFEKARLEEQKGSGKK